MQSLRDSNKFHFSRSNFILPILLFLIGLIIVSCSVESKIAEEKVLKSKFKAVIIGPKFIHKVNLKTDLLSKEDSLSAINLDSLSYYRSEFIQYLDDSIFLHHCMISMQNELITNYNLTLYNPDYSFDELPDSTFILKIAEMEIEELYAISEMVLRSRDGGYYYEEHLVNSINLNTWFELRYKVPSKELFPILYTSHNYYVPIDESKKDLNIDNSINDTINLTSMLNIYESAELFGKQYASYFYDYMLNVKIFEQMPKGKKPNYYMHYDYNNGRTYPIYEDMFIELDD